MKQQLCPDCGKALVVVESERHGLVTAHQSPICAGLQKQKDEGAPELVAITFVFVGLVPPEGRPRCLHFLADPAGVQCALPAGHRGAHRGKA